MTKKINIGKNKTTNNPLSNDKAERERERERERK